MSVEVFSLIRFGRGLQNPLLRSSAKARRVAWKLRSIAGKTILEKRRGPSMTHSPHLILEMQIKSPATKFCKEKLP